MNMVKMQIILLKQYHFITAVWKNYELRGYVVISNIGALHDSSQFFVWSLTVGGWNNVNTPYKTTHKTSLKFSV